MREAIASERRRVNTMRETEPYTLREYLYDSGWIETQHGRYDADPATIDAGIAKCNAFLDPIFAGVQTGDAPQIAPDLWEDFVERMYLSGRY